MIVGALRASAVMVGSQADHHAVAALLADRGIKPVIDRVFAIDAVEDAYARAAAGVFGKVVIKID